MTRHCQLSGREKGPSVSESLQNDLGEACVVVPPSAEPNFTQNPFHLVEMEGLAMGF